MNFLSHAVKAHLIALLLAIKLNLPYPFQLAVGTSNFMFPGEYHPPPLPWSFVTALDLTALRRIGNGRSVV